MITVFSLCSILFKFLFKVTEATSPSTPKAELNASASQDDARTSPSSTNAPLNQEENINTQEANSHVVSSSKIDLLCSISDDLSEDDTEPDVLSLGFNDLLQLYLKTRQQSHSYRAKCLQVKLNQVIHYGCLLYSFAIVMIAYSIQISIVVTIILNFSYFRGSVFHSLHRE